MKSNFKKIIISIFSICAILLCIFGYKYYSEVYVTRDAFAIVPNEIPEKLEAKDPNGKVIKGIYSYKYKLTLVDKNGNKIDGEALIEGEDPVPLIPNSFVKSKVSKKRVGVPIQAEEAEIPKKVLEILKK